MQAFKFSKPTNDVETIVQAFLKGVTSKRSGNYFVQDNRLVYRTVVDKEYRNYWHADELVNRRAIKQLKEAAAKGQIRITAENDRKIEYQCVVSDLIALKLPNGHIIGNSSVLQYVGRRVAFGKEVLNRVETDVQRYLSQFIPMIPFTVFEQAKLDINTFVMVDKSPEEIIKRKRVTYDSKGRKREKLETVHFTGASLFNVSGKTYLFDCDRRELEFHIFNPFLVEIPEKYPVKTIGSAYEALKPDAVTLALKYGADVKRQGEWFFIPVKVDSIPEGVKVFGANTDPNKEVWQRETLKLQAGNNRPNHAQTGFIHNEIAFVKGKIEHSGREHHDLILNDWHIAVPNTATNSFTIQGDID